MSGAWRVWREQRGGGGSSGWAAGVPSSGRVPQAMPVGPPHSGQAPVTSRGRVWPGPGGLTGHFLLGGRLAVAGHCVPTCAPSCAARPSLPACRQHPKPSSGLAWVTGARQGWGQGRPRASPGPAHTAGRTGTSHPPPSPAGVARAGGARPHFQHGALPALGEATKGGWDRSPSAPRALLTLPASALS